MQASDIPTVERALDRELFRVGRTVGTIKITPQLLGLDVPIDKAALYTLFRLQEDGPVRLSDLAASLQLDLSTVSRQVKALEEADAVGRTPDPAGRRACLLEITDRGREVVGAITAARRRLLAAALADWSEKDRSTLTTLLGRLADDLRPELVDETVHATAGTTDKEYA